MIRVIKIIYSCKSGGRLSEHPAGLTFLNKAQMETYRRYLLRKDTNITNVFFTYDESN